MSLKLWRRACGVLLALLLLDLVFVLVGGFSLVSPDSEVASLDLLWRLTAFGAAFALRFRLLAEDALRVSRSRLLLVMLLLPTLFQFQFSAGRTGGDGIMYYVYVRSAFEDFDLHFANEYDHYGFQNRPDLQMPTKTGHRRSIFAIGPAVLWTPFFALGEAVARVEGALGRPADLSGYGPAHVNACALGSLLYGFATLLLIQAVLSRHFSSGLAVSATLVTWGTTFLHWYLLQQPLMSHATSAFGAAVCFWLWDRDRGRRTAFGYALLGLLLGVAMTVRWQNGALLLLPGLELLQRLREQGRSAWKPVLWASALLGGMALIGAFPQLAAWKVLFDMWVLPYPPHGRDFVRLTRPFVLETLFSSRHGLLSWTPSLWLAWIGFAPLLKRRFSLAAPVLPLVLFMSYVNMCSGDWWAGGSFSNRRFDPLLLPFALGFAAGLEWLIARVRRAPRFSLCLLLLPVLSWNVALSLEARHTALSPDFPDLVHASWARVADSVGSPQTWPASLLFAARNSRPPSQYDELVGRYLFYRQNNRGGQIRLGVSDDASLLGEGFGEIESANGVAFRSLTGPARLFAPLDLPEDLSVCLRSRSASSSPVRVSVAVNGSSAGWLTGSDAFAESCVSARSALWRQDLNDVEIRVSGGELWLETVRFVRGPRS